MIAPILVLGASGVLGRKVVIELTRRKLPIIILTRRGESRQVDQLLRIVVGEVAEPSIVEVAARGAGAVIMCATDRFRPRRVDLAAARNLLDLDNRDLRFIYPDLVGSDLVPSRYLKTKREVMNRLAGSGRPYAWVRSTHFHGSVWDAMARRAAGPVMFLPAGVRYQPVDPALVARVMVEGAIAGSEGDLGTIGGAFIYEAHDLARSYLSATRKRRPIVALNRPGIAGAAERAGAHLTEIRTQGGDGWNEFIDSIPRTSR